MESQAASREIVYATRSPVQQDYQTQRDLSFQFHGNASEYFRIWIVNILLSLLTLGIYSAWAKVRTQQYFHGNTALDGTSFQYLATPIQILRGRVIAVVIFALYAVSGHVSSLFHMATLILLALAAPALMVYGLSFRLRYSAWRNIRFGFDRDVRSAYRILLPPLLLLILLYVLMYVSMRIAGIEPGKHADPKHINIHAIGSFFLVIFAFFGCIPWLECLVTRLLVNNACYGTSYFSMTAKVRDYYALYTRATLIFIGVTCLFCIPLFMGIGFVSKASHTHLDSKWSVVITLLPVLFVWLAANACLQAGRFNLRYGEMRLGRHRFSSSITTETLLELYFTNTLAIILSLGLLIPWAKIRTVRYRLSCLALHCKGGLDHFLNDASEASAAPAELSSLFDLDIAL
jgi:uncharacterized membrane protein YjgN (DUF898 family)